MWRAFVLISVMLMRVGAQTTLQVASGSWTALSGTWRWQAGDNTQWASATFDDSHWSPLRIPGPLPPDRQYWIRLPVQTGRMSDPGLLLGPIAYAYDIYWDGQRIGSFGDLSRNQWFVPRWQTFHVPRELASPGDHVIAVRVGQIGTNFGTRGTHLNPGDSRVGDFATLRDVESAHMSAEVQHGILEMLITFGLALAGLYFLLLPPSVSQGAAFRWLGITVLGRALTVLCEFYASYGPFNMPGSVLITLTWTFIFVHMLGSTEFPYALFRRQAPVAGWSEPFT